MKNVHMCYIRVTEGKLKICKKIAAERSATEIFIGEKEK